MAHDIFRYLIAKKNKTKQTSSQCNCYPLVFALAKYIFIFSDRNSICGKVMFSQACVKNSVHGGGGIPACYGACISLGRHSPRQLSTPPRQTSTASPRQTLPGRHPLQDGHCSGRYASYWNAFLLSLYYFQKECGFFDYGLEPRPCPLLLWHHCRLTAWTPIRPKISLETGVTFWLTHYFTTPYVQM